MASKIQGRYLDEIRDKMTKKWKNKCEAKYGVAEKMQNQNGGRLPLRSKDAN